MALFQKTVEQKYLKQFDAALINAKYLEFKTHFGNPDIQENIRNSKEEQYQGEFLIDLFVKILGYVKNPTPNFNLTTEYKNVKDSKKADGAIIINDSVKAVIELKGTNTTDLSKIESQAFGYKNNQTDCVYVVTSNFEKLRFYIDNAIEHIEFNLFTLSKADFEILYLCLSFESIKNGLPKKVKDESLSQEDVITKKLYQDYSLFKRELHQNLVSLNPQYDSLTLFKKSQKLLDRFLFLFFAEDRNLLPPNSVRLILNDWRDLQERDVDIALYQRFKKYFEYLNTGFKGKRYDVFAYNGGLFKPDEVLDTILIDDELLFKHTSKLSDYDFASEVDVNILGHIFENSLNELDEINAQLTGEEIDKTTTRRKKDGVFYTPKYITKYIVENTVGKLCTEKKAELQIVEEEYVTDKRRQLKTKQALLDKLKTYQNWLLQLTICDPACGSGAFLNQALDFLITEHRYIDELQAKLLGVPIIFSDIEKSILENNLFGVDLNEESVEIAKLSLWLRTAQPNRKLNDLNNNIKCGNSLISDPAVAGDKAFNWNEGFPQVFGKGGFDVVIGNPPYLRIQGIKNAYPELANFYQINYLSATGNYDIYVLFMEKSIELINEKGIVSFILPHKFLISDFGVGIRSLFANNKQVANIVHFGSELVFQDATTYTCIISLTKKINLYIYFKQVIPSSLFDGAQANPVSYANLDEKQWILSSGKASVILDKLKIQPLLLRDIFDRFVQGIITGKDSVFCVTGEFTGEYLKIILPNNEEYLIEKGILKPHLRGEDVNKYKWLENNEWLIFPYKLVSNKAILFSPEEMKSRFPKAYEYLSQFEYILKERENGKFDNELWYQYSRNQAISVLEQSKIITPEVCFGGSMTLDLNNFYHNSKCHTLLINKNSNYQLKSILPILNSKLFWFYLSISGNILRSGYIGVKRHVLELFPVPNITENDNSLFVEKAVLMLSLNKELQETAQKFQRNIQREYNLKKLSTKLENWFQLSFNEFLKELEKSKVKLTLSQKAEWEDYFLQESKKALDIKHQIDTTDKEIDQMVYVLYGLTADEIKIVEG